MACSPELQSLWKHFHDLQCSICNPEQLAVEASAVNLIPTVVKEQICNHGGTVAEKTRLLILRIEQEVASNPVALHFFLAIISKHSSLAECAGQLRTSLVQHGGVCINIAEAITGAQHTLGDCDPNPLETETASNSDQNDGIGPCLEADRNASVQSPSLTLKNLSEELVDVIQWYMLGIKLNLPQSVLATIEANHPKDVERCRVEMLTKWLQRTPTASWGDIVQALYEMNLNSVAQRVQRVHGVPFTVKQDPPCMVTTDNPASSFQSGSSEAPASPSPLKRMRMDNCLPMQMQGNLVEVLAETVRTIYRNRPEVREDCWPPVKKSQYINLALLENELMDFRNEFSRYTVRGSVDDIMKNKNKISYSRIFENAEVGSRLLLEGRPGSGKTTLMNKISRDWAQEVILNSLVSLLILVPLRQLTGKTQVTLETLLSFIPDDKAQQLGKHIHSFAGEGMCFALDGLDEYSATNVQSDFVYKLIKKECLPKSIVIVASRPAASQKFRRHVDQSIEVLGFLRPQIEHFISENFAPDEKLAQDLKAYLDHHPNVLHMCYLPVHAAIVTFLFSILGEKLPETETEIYKQFTLQTLIRTHLKAKVEVDANLTLKSFEGLPHEQYQLFCGICELALNATVNQKQGFTHEEVKEFFPVESRCPNEKSLGLITVDRQLMLYGPTNTYSFLHLTFQEFLAAYHLTTLNEEKQYQLVSSYHDKLHMHVVWKFFCGLKKFKSDHDLKCFQSIISGAPPCTLHHLHCTYDSQSEVTCQSLVLACNKMLSLTKETLNPADGSAVAFIIANTGVHIEEIKLESCNIDREGFETLAEVTCNDLCHLNSLSLSGTKINDPSAAKVLACFMEKAAMLSSLKIDRCGLQLKEFVELAPLLPKLSQLEALSMQHNSLAKKTGESLRVALKDMLHLKELDIDTEVLRSSGVYELYQLCKSLKTVRVWRKHLLFECIASSSEEAVVRIHEVIQKDGSVLVTGLRTVLRRSGFPRLQFKRERNVDAALRTDSLESVKIKIDLSREFIGDAGCIGLVAVLKEYKELQALDLAYNKIGEGLSKLANGLKECPNLKELNLDSNGIRQEGCSALTAALQQCKQLQVLSLGDSAIGDEGLSILANGLKKCQNLKELYLDLNNLTDASIEPLTTLIMTAKSFTTLNLWGNNFTPDGEKQLRQAAEERKCYPDFVELNLCV